MRYGVCGGPKIARIARRAGFDFAESTVKAWLAPADSPAAFQAQLINAKKAALPYPVLNGFIPRSLRIVGPGVDTGALSSYARTTLERAEQAGVSVIVFGSGGARRIPDGFDRATARDQLFEFCSMTATIAQEHGVTIALEPLSRGECNVLNTVGACAAMVRAVNHPSFRLLLDTYHFLVEGDQPEDLMANLDLLCHVHVATAPHRLPPGSEPCDSMLLLLASLAQAGYEGRVSIEAKVARPRRELPRALGAMRQTMPSLKGADMEHPPERKVAVLRYWDRLMRRWMAGFGKTPAGDGDG